MSKTGFKQDNIGAFIVKDPDATLDYTIDWSGVLSGSDTISSVAYDVESGLSLSTAIGGANFSNTTTTSTCNLTGGTVDTIYSVECTITTSEGRTFVRHFRVKVEKQQL
jgi:hypothetical protein